MSVKLLLYSLYQLHTASLSDSVVNHKCTDSLSTDAAIVHTLTTIRNPELVFTSKLISNSLVPVSLAIPTIHLVYGYAEKNRDIVLNGLLIASAEVVQFGVMTGLKSLIQRERPFIAHKDCIIPNDMESFWSFPSGHSSGSACLATILSLRYNNWIVTSTSISYSLYTLFARLHLGVHYPTDVAAGALIGIGTGILIHSLSSQFEKMFDSILPQGSNEIGVISPPSTPLMTLSLPL
ncbi:MAG TPA: phosphatase PAP2 family protein [Candidatus Kapabacteria bacterium]|nr:phosphatase PAP2 family protein [Candidatus Kapabacteria bacterium]